MIINRFFLHQNGVKINRKKTYFPQILYHNIFHIAFNLIKIIKYVTLYWYFQLTSQEKSSQTDRCGYQSFIPSTTRGTDKGPVSSAKLTEPITSLQTRKQSVYNFPDIITTCKLLRHQPIPIPQYLQLTYREEVSGYQVIPPLV